MSDEPTPVVLPVAAGHDDAGGQESGTSHRSAVMYRLGGREYPLKTEPRCKVCNHHSRVTIEDALLRGRGYKAVWKLLSEPDQTEISIDNIKCHYRNGHMPADASITRVALEERAREISQIVDDHEGTIVDHIGLLRETVRLTFERVVAGEIKVSLDHGLEAAKALAQLGLHEGSEVDTDVWRLAVTEMMQVAQAIMTPEQFQEYGVLLIQNPVLRSIREKFVQAEAKAIG